MKKVISTQDAPLAIGAYSQAVLVDGILYISGQIPINPRDFKTEKQREKNISQKRLCHDGGLPF